MVSPRRRAAPRALRHRPKTMQKFGDHVTLTRDGRVATVTLDRNDGLNALSTAVMRELINVADTLSTDTETSAVILTGRGVFSAGADLKDPAREKTARGTLLERRQALKIGPDMCGAWERLEQVTIAAIEKFCIGGGVAIAVACDHRIIASDAHMRLPEIPLGMNMSWQSNPRTAALIGPSKAKLFTILGEKCEATQALDWGLVDDVVAAGETEVAAQALAARYAALPPLAVRMTKQSINAAIHALSYATSYMDRDQFALAASSKDQAEAISAFLERRKPTFRGD